MISINPLELMAQSTLLLEHFLLLNLSLIDFSKKELTSNLKPPSLGV